MADYCGAFVSHVSLLLTEGGKNSSTLRFDHILEQLHTDRGRGRQGSDGEAGGESYRAEVEQTKIVVMEQME